MEETVALLGDDALDNTFLGVVVEGDGVGVVFGAVLLEIGASDDIVGGVGSAVGVKGLCIEVHLHMVGAEQHAVVVDGAVSVEIGAARVEIHGYRVLGLVFDDMVNGPLRHLHQGVDVGLRPRRNGHQEGQKKGY